MPTIRSPTLHDDVPHRAPAARRRRARRRCPRTPAPQASGLGTRASRGSSACVLALVGVAAVRGDARRPLGLGARRGRRARPSGSCASRASSRATRMALRVWPLAVELDGRARGVERRGRAARSSARASRVRPKLFALLAGKLAIDQVDLDEPRVRVVVRDGKLANLTLPRRRARTEPKGRAARPVQHVRGDRRRRSTSTSTTCASRRSSLDLDVTRGRRPRRAGRPSRSRPRGPGEVHRPRAAPDGKAAGDRRRRALLGRGARAASSRARSSCAASRASARPTSTPPPARRRPATCPPTTSGASSSRSATCTSRSRRTAGQLPDRRRARPRARAHRARRARRHAARDRRLGRRRPRRPLRATTRSLPELGGTLEAHDVRLAQYSLRPGAPQPVHDPRQRRHEPPDDAPARRRRS